MARPVRYEAAGAVYHVMARGDGGRSVFERDEDHLFWLDVLERACLRFGWRVHAFVLMRHEYNVARAVRRVREEKELAKRFVALRRKSEGWD